MARRVESPSSINTYNQCPRKYFYTYIAKFPTKGNIHTIKGNVVHSVLENFFEYELPEDISWENAEQQFKEILFLLFAKYWREKKLDLEKISISEGETAIGIDDCVNMLYQWSGFLLKKMKSTGLPFREAFKQLSPTHKEKYFKSQGDSVHGFIDVIEEKDGRVRLMDYKTSGSAYLTDEYLLQLGIYALLYQENVESVPHEVGIYFLRDNECEKVLSVTETLLGMAKRQIREHHSKTISDNFQDYPRKVSHLCKWPSGQCDFYNICFHRNGAQKQENEIGQEINRHKNAVKIIPVKNFSRPPNGSSNNSQNSSQN